MAAAGGGGSRSDSLGTRIIANNLLCLCSGQMTGNQAGSSTQRTQQDKGQRTVEWSGRQWQRRLRPALAIGNVAKVLWHTRTHINKHTHTHIHSDSSSCHEALQANTRHTHILYTHTLQQHTNTPLTLHTHTHTHTMYVAMHSVELRLPPCPTPSSQRPLATLLLPFCLQCLF